MTSISLFEGWSLSRRLATATIAAGALLVGVVSVSAVLLSQTREQQDLVTIAYYDAGRLSSDYFLHLVDAETAVRNFSATGDESVLGALDVPNAPWEPGATTAIRSALRHDPGIAAEVQALEVAAQQWYRGWASPAVTQLRAGTPLTAAQVQEGKTLFAQVRQTYADYLTNLRGVRADALERLNRFSTALFYAALASALVAVGAAALLWVLLRSWVSRPVAALAAETRVVGGGHLGHTVSVAGPPEFVRLGEDVESMRQRLVAQIAVVEQAGQEVAQARRRLEEQAVELHRSNRELEQFASVASHDLQEPLRKVASFCQLLERRYAGQLDERADQYIAFAVDGAQRMQRLINDLLEFSRVGRTGSGMDDVDLDRCLQRALENLAVAIEESGAQVTADPLPVIRGEAALLTQVLQNLIQNAIKFRTPDRPPAVRITASQSGTHWEFACSDNGIGIGPEYAEQVFVIFQRLHPKDVYGGTGIGLAMCKKIIEYHGGRIWVDQGSAPGTSIRWTLPVVTGPRPATGAGGGSDLEADRAVA